MSTEVLDERARHVALVRAQASLIVDSSRPVRRLTVSPGTRLSASPRKRRHSHRGKAPAPPVARRHTSWRRRIIAIGALTVQVALLVLVLTLPAFQVRKVMVLGARLVTTSAVVAAAEVPEESIFTINGAAIQSRVLALPWVESAVVTTQLPATVSIDIVERTPALRIRRDGADTLVAANGATLPGIDATPAASRGIPVLIDDRAGSPQPLNPQLVQMLSTIAQRFPAVFGCSVDAYLWGADDVVSIWTSTGWRAVLGPLDTRGRPPTPAEAGRDAGRAQGPAQLRASHLRVPGRRVVRQPGERRIARASRRGPGGAAADHPRNPAAAGRVVRAAADAAAHADVLTVPRRQPDAGDRERQPESLAVNLTEAVPDTDPKTLALTAARF